MLEEGARRRMVTRSNAFITGASSGVGLSAAPQLGRAGFERVVFTARSEGRAAQHVPAFQELSPKTEFRPLGLSLGEPDSVAAAAASFKSSRVTLDAVLLNAGLVSGPERHVCASGAELTFAAALIGHHQLLHQLLEQGSLSENARIIIAGGELARGDTPGMSVIQLEAAAGAALDGDRTNAAEAIMRGAYPEEFKPAHIYSTAKSFVAAWVTEMAKRLPPGTTLNAVSPGFTPSTGAAREAPSALRLRMKLLKYVGRFVGLGHSTESAAHRYIEALDFGDDVTGKFFASPPGKQVGPLTENSLAILEDPVSPKAVYDAVVRIAGVG